MNKIEIFNQTNEQIIELEDVKRVIDIAIDNQKLDNLEFNIIIVDNDYIHNLNKEYRKNDRTNYVITFALEDFHFLIKHVNIVLWVLFILLEKA